MKNVMNYFLFVWLVVLGLPTTSYALVGLDEVKVGSAELYFSENIQPKGEVLCFPERNKCIAGYSFDGVPFIVFIPKVEGEALLAYIYVDDEGNIGIEKKTIKVVGKDDDDGNDDDDDDDGEPATPFLKAAKTFTQTVPKTVGLEYCEQVERYCSSYEGSNVQAFREGLRKYLRLMLRNIPQELERIDDEVIGKLVESQNPSTVEEYKKVLKTFVDAVRSEYND